MHRYGDLTTFERHYDSMKDYFNYLLQHGNRGRSSAGNNTIELGLPDWSTYNATPRQVDRYRNILPRRPHHGAAARLLSKEGGREEREGDEKYFKELAKKVKGPSKLCTRVRTILVQVIIAAEPLWETIVRQP